MRGIASIANAVTLPSASARVVSGDVSGARNPTRIELSPSLPISSRVGATTFTTTSALHGSPILAPASSNSSSGISAASPAPDSTTTSTSFAPRRLTTSGTIATRRSPSAVSFGTPTIIGGGKVSERPRGSRPAPVARPLSPRRAHRERPPRQAGQRLGRDPDRCLGARAGVADAAVRGDERAQVPERRAGSATPDAPRVPAARDQPLDGPGGRLRVRPRPGLQREAPVGVLVACD